MRPFSRLVGFVRHTSIPLGGDEEDRTPDPLRARQVLSQLSYTPISGTQACHSYPILLKVKTFKIEQHLRFQLPTQV